jgi:hypothetical protein
MNFRDANPGRRGAKPATNGLSYGMAPQHKKLQRKLQQMERKKFYMEL